MQITRATAATNCGAESGLLVNSIWTEAMSQQALNYMSDLLWALPLFSAHGCMYILACYLMAVADLGYPSLPDNSSRNPARLLFQIHVPL